MQRQKITLFAIIASAFLLLHLNTSSNAQSQPANSQQADKTRNPFFNYDFPQGFGWGVAESAWQVEGDQTAEGTVENNWAAWDTKLGNKVGKACERWTRYEADADLMQQCGFNMCRISIEWSKIERQKGVFDVAAMNHYIAYIDALKKRGIEPVVMLFHHTWPVWFGEKGAFEKAENVQDFVDFAVYVFKKLHHKVKMWMTLNEPEGYIMQGYFRGEYPPGKKNLALAGRVLLNMLNAHVAVYQKLKAIDCTASIGYAKIVQPIEPYHSWHLLEALVSKIFDKLFNETTLDFFKNGIFAWKILTKTYVSDINQQAPQSLDFIGVNYYSRTSLKLFLRGTQPFAPTPHEDEQLTDDGRVIYPEGLYRALQRCAVLGKPLHVTEIGLADKNGKHRNQFFEQHIAQIARARNDGFDVRSCFIWTLMDNYEWRHGYETKYGLFAVNFATQERTLRESASHLVEFIKAQTSKGPFEDKCTVNKPVALINKDYLLPSLKVTALAGCIGITSFLLYKQFART